MVMLKDDRWNGRCRCVLPFIKVRIESRVAVSAVWEAKVLRNAKTLSPSCPVSATGLSSCWLPLEPSLASTESFSVCFQVRSCPGLLLFQVKLFSDEIGDEVGDCDCGVPLSLFSLIFSASNF